MRYGEEAQQKLLYAAQMATTLGYADRPPERQGVAGHVRRAGRCGFVQPSNSMAQVVRMTDHLDDFQPVQKTRMAECLTELIGRMKRREIVMIFSDFFTDLDALEAALQRMRYNRHEVVLFQVMHHDELDLRVRTA